MCLVIDLCMMLSAEASGLRACRGRLVAQNPPILLTYELWGKIYPHPTPSLRPRASAQRICGNPPRPLASGRVDQAISFSEPLINPFS